MGNLDLEYLENIENIKSSEMRRFKLKKKAKLLV